MPIRRLSSPSLVVRDLKLALSSPSPYARASRVKLLLRLARAHEACGDAGAAREDVAELRRLAKEVGNAKEKVIIICSTELRGGSPKEDKWERLGTILK